MKKIIFLIAATLSIMLTNVAEAFTVEAPKWKKIAIATTDGVNIRQEPSASSPRLLVDWEKVDNYQVPVNYFGYWSSATPKGSVEAISFSGPSPVVTERGEWLEILNAGPKCDTNGWVNSKFCKVVTPTPITSSNTAQFNNFNLISSEQDEVFGLYAICDAEMDKYAVFYLGKLIDGVVVAPYSLYCNTAEMDDSHIPGFFKEGDSFAFYFNSSMATDENLDVHKLPSEVFSQLLDYITKSKYDAVIYLSEGELNFVE